MSNEKLKTKTE